MRKVCGRVVEIPGGPNIELRWCGRNGSPWVYSTFRECLAWWLRKLADRIDNKPRRGPDRRTTVSFTISGRLPPGTTDQEFSDAMSIATMAAAKYIAELDEDMRVQ